MTKALYETFIMVLIPTLCAVAIGIPLGSILFLRPNAFLYRCVTFFVNTVRSFPYLIFVVVLIPVTRWVCGTGFGLIPAAFPICFVASALYARFVEQAFYEVSPSVLDYARSVGSSPLQLIYHVLIVESRQSLVLGLTSTIISIISYSSVMGIVGGGGIGDYAMRYGYYEYDYGIVFKMVLLIAIIVFSIQFIGTRLSKHLDKKRRPHG